MITHLNFVSRSPDSGQRDIVLFQKNSAGSASQSYIAWKVIRHCSHDWMHPFQYSTQIAVSIGDDFGNYSPKISNANGLVLAVSATPSGRRLRPDGVAASQSEIQIVNRLPTGAVNVNIYNGCSLVARRNAVAPRQTVVFQRDPILWIGAAWRGLQGDTLHLSTLSAAPTGLRLEDIAAADIVMTGGGPGIHSAPYAFTLENVVRA